MCIDQTYHSELFGAANPGNKTKEIEVPIFGIRISIDPGGDTGEVKSGILAAITDKEDASTEAVASSYAIEDMILHHALAGINVTTPEYCVGIKAAVHYACMMPF